MRREARRRPSRARRPTATACRSPPPRARSRRGSRAGRRARRSPRSSRRNWKMPTRPCSPCGCTAGSPSCDRRRVPSSAPQELRRDAQLGELGLGRLVRLAAVRAELPREALREHGRDRRAGEERLDAHLAEARDRRGRVVRVQRREDEVARESGLDRDLRRLGVADLADHDDVGVRAEDRAQRRGEREPRTDVDLHLVHAGEPVLDRDPRR